MTEEQKKMAFAFGAGFAVGAGSCIVYRRWKASRADNMVSSRPIPKELRVRPCEGGVFFGAAPPSKRQKAEKQCEGIAGSQLMRMGISLCWAVQAQERQPGWFILRLEHGRAALLRWIVRAEWKKFGKFCTQIAIKSCLYLLHTGSMAAHVLMIPLQSCGRTLSML